MPQSAYTLRNEDFINTVYVVCLKCNAQALVLGGQPYKTIAEYEMEVRFSCTSCGFSVKYINTPKFTAYINNKGQAVTSRLLIQNAPCDPFFGFDVWYQVETKHGLLWAYNLEHLTVIESYIADTHRTRNGLPYKNNSIGSRLPQWIKNAKNRIYLLKIIARLKKF
ncbi:MULTISPECIES: hypothetical protein [Sphingobacterium]|uniref:hypothetical protein n=1 Tax=Sphingobacterium TaxID=28453 RepID=UPI0010505C60|nr:MULTISPECIES: hypothetical protein [Sphingobacterium]MCW2262222.1 hypothetical protein [Sphingobacterium kitahiroshimense]TCR13030.1 hypothetical protein EDF67_102443 [Sphingobacterium sp. JUb78]